jgi:hypothetical protein
VWLLATLLRTPMLLPSIGLRRTTIGGGCIWVESTLSGTPLDILPCKDPHVMRMLRKRQSLYLAFQQMVRKAYSMTRLSDVGSSGSEGNLESDRTMRSHLAIPAPPIWKSTRSKPKPRDWANAEEPPIVRWKL